MFDIGFWELTIIGIVALLVIGPERLPGVARTAGAWIGRGKRFVSGVKADIDKELRADELKRILEKQSNSNPMHEIIEETKTSLRDIEEKTGRALKDSKDAADTDDTADAKDERPSDS